MRLLLMIFFLMILTNIYGQTEINQFDVKGLKQGYWFKCNDSICETGYYSNDKRSGQWVFYKYNRIEKILEYKNDTLNGFSMSFNNNGSLHRKFFYKIGKLNETAEFYSTQGVLLAKYQYLNDNILTVEYYAINKESPPRNHGYVPKLE